MIVSKANDFAEIITPENYREVLVPWSDALEEESRDTEATCLRWCLAKNKVPRIETPKEYSYSKDVDGFYVWHGSYTNSISTYYLEYDLQQSLVDEKGSGKNEGRWYSTCGAAYLALLKVWRPQ